MKRAFKIISLLLAIILASSVLFSCNKIEIGGDEDNNSKDNAGGGEGFTIPVSTMSDDTVYTEGSFKYAVYDDETALITEHTGDEAEIVIPDKLGGYTVTTIGAGAFYENANATSVKMGDNIKIIGASAFGDSPKLASVTIPETVWAIYPDAFTGTPWLDSNTEEFVIVGDSVLLQYNGSASRVVIPDTVKHISDAFLGNETIKDVVIPDSVYTVGCAAFSSSSLVRASLGKNVVLIDDSAFAYCYDLHSINIPDSVKVIESYAFSSCTGLNYIKLGRGVETIASYAFYRMAQFTYIYLPKSIKTIGDFAFEDCNFLSYVYYEGTEEDFKALELSGSNYMLTDAKVFYNFDYSKGGIYEEQ